MEMKVTTTLTLEGGVPRVMKVPSSCEVDKKHTVVLHCSCPGFRYWGKCKHLEQAAKLTEFKRKDVF